MIKDRIASGFIAGLLAGIVMNIIDYISYFLIKFDTRELLLDWTAVMLFGRLAQSLPEFILAQVAQIFFAGFLGIVFSYALLKLTSGHYLLKGWIYGVITWFFIYAVTIAFQVPLLKTHFFEAVATNIVAASAYGLILAEALNYLDSKSTVGSK